MKQTFSGIKTKNQQTKAKKKQKGIKCSMPDYAYETNVICLIVGPYY